MPATEGLADEVDHRCRRLAGHRSRKPDGSGTIGRVGKRVKPDENGAARLYGFCLLKYEQAMNRSLA